MLFLRATLQRRHRGDEELEIELDQIDVRDRDRDVRADDHALVEHSVDQIAEDQLIRLVQIIHFLQRARLVAHRCFARVKLYGGQGPVKSKVSPRGSYSATRLPTAVRNSSNRARSTRKAPLSTSV